MNDVGTLPAAHDVAHRTTRRWGAAVCLGAAVLCVVANTQVTYLEAWLSAVVLDFTGLARDPHQVNSAVIFAHQNHDQYVGLLVTPGCSIALLLVPFLLAAAGLLWAGRGRARSIASALAVLVGFFILTNQLRLATVVVAIEQLGFERGYELSHVALGSLISGVGFVVGVLLFVRLIIRGGKRERSHA